MGKWWNYAIKYFIPLVLSVLVVMQFLTELKGNYEGYPDWAISLGWLAVAIPLVIGIGLAVKPVDARISL